TGGMLQMLGVGPLAGRLLTPEDDVPGASRPVVISEGLWNQAFGRDPSALGRNVQLNNRPATIVGVMGADFQFPPGELNPAEMWVPLQLGPPNPARRGNHFLYLL